MLVENPRYECFFRGKSTNTIRVQWNLCESLSHRTYINSDNMKMIRVLIC